MTLKSLNKKIGMTTIAVLTASSLLGAATIFVNAADGTGNIVINAQQAAPQTNGTPSDGIPNIGQGSSQTNAAGTTNDGSAQTLSGGTMANVTFSYTPITPTGTADKMVAPVWGTSGQTTAGSGYTAGTATPITTNASGVADTGQIPDGYYLVQQVTKVGGVYEIQPFIVQVNNGTTNVYPKMDLTTANAIYDTAVTNAVDTVTGDPNNKTATANTMDDDGSLTDTDIKDTGNTTTAGAGNTVAWNLNATFDGSQVTNSTTANTPDTAGSYVITDTLPTGVTLANASNVTIPSVTSSDGSTTTPLSLTSGTDYTVSQSGQTVTVTLTAAGQEKVATALGLGQTGTINVQIPTTVNDDFVGTATNSYTTAVTNAYGVDLSNTTPATATLNVGGIDITKEDAATGQAGSSLGGATFVLVKAANLADAQAYVKANASSLTNNVPTGQLTAPSGNTAQLVLGSDGKPLSAVASSDASSDLSFTGIDLSGSGNSKDTTQGTSNGTAYNGTNNDKGNYYAVEVIAPTGYQLPSAAAGANVYGGVLATTTPTATDNSVLNSKPFNLPFTGGKGIIAILVFSATVAGGAILIRRRSGEVEMSE